MENFSILDAKDLQSVDGPPFADLTGVLRGRVILSIKPDLTFSMVDDPSNPPDYGKFVEQCEGKAVIAILKRSIVEFVLDATAKWEFDPEKAAIEFKYPPDRKYYNVQYQPRQKPQLNVVLHAQPTGKPQTDPQTHPFSFNILIPSEGGGQLPVTIDPDVKNPPPVNG